MLARIHQTGLCWPYNGFNIHIVIRGLTARIAGPEEQPLFHKQATMEELLEAVFSVRSVPRLYGKAIETSPVSLQ
jgi:hypothetical protein